MSDDSVKIWLWRNGDHNLGYFHEYPCYGNGDPMTLGEPVGFALVKPSFSRDFFNGNVAKNSQPQPSPQTSNEGFKTTLAQAMCNHRGSNHNAGSQNYKNPFSQSAPQEETQATSEPQKI